MYGNYSQMSAAGSDTLSVPMAQRATATEESAKIENITDESNITNTTLP